jgi:hypothetical protein
LTVLVTVLYTGQKKSPSTSSVTGELPDRTFLYCWLYSSEWMFGITGLSTPPTLFVTVCEGVVTDRLRGIAYGHKVRRTQKTGQSSLTSHMYLVNDQLNTHNRLVTADTRCLHRHCTCGHCSSVQWTSGYCSCVQCPQCQCTSGDVQKVNAVAPLIRPSYRGALKTTMG